MNQLPKLEESKTLQDYAMEWLKVSAFDIVAESGAQREIYDNHREETGQKAVDVNKKIGSKLKMNLQLRFTLFITKYKDDQDSAKQQIIHTHLIVQRMLNNEEYEGVIDFMSNRLYDPIIVRKIVNDENKRLNKKQSNSSGQEVKTLASKIMRVQTLITNLP